MPGAPGSPEGKKSYFVIRNSYFGVMTFIPGPRTDWILYRGLKPAEVETVTRSDNGRYPSDHYPVYAQFDFEEAA